MVANVLYYASDTPFYRYSNLPAGYYDGLHSINLKDLSWKKLSNQILVSICYCDGEYLYCYTEANHGVFAIKADGSQKISVTGCCDEFAGLEGNQQGFLKGNLFYYLKDNSHVYVRDKNGGNDRWLGRIPPSDRAYIESVTDDHIYCVTINFSDPSEQIVYEIDR